MARLSTPWNEVHGKQNTFSISGVEELINVGMLIGKHIERIVKIGDLKVILAVGQDLTESVDLFETTIKALVPAAVDLFGGVPVINGMQTGKFVVIANKDVFDGARNLYPKHQHVIQRCSEHAQQKRMGTYYFARNASSLERTNDS